MESLPWKQKEDVTWSELRQFGVGWWLTDIEMLTLSIEKVICLVQLSTFTT